MTINSIKKNKHKKYFGFCFPISAEELTWLLTYNVSATTTADISENEYLLTGESPICTCAYHSKTTNLNRGIVRSVDVVVLTFLQIKSRSLNCDNWRARGR